MNVASPIRILCVDPNVTRDSPSMKGFLSTLPHLTANGFQIEIWCLRCEAPRDMATIRLLPAAPALGTLENVWFVVIANLLFVWRTCVHGIKTDLIYSTGAYCLFANVVHVHFDSAEWLRAQSRMGKLTRKERARRLITRLGAALEWLSWHSPWSRHFITVSDGMAANLRQKLSTDKTVHVLPNSYDSTRFHPGVRDEWRAPMRQQLQLAPGAFMFIFIATGHLQRKGFWSVLRVLHRLRQMRHTDLRLLIVGGSDSLWKTHAAEIAHVTPDHAEWLMLAGSQREVERYYAAADAFILPSYFETFALVAQEALSCGMRIFVTPYWGHEMYLRQDDNGWLLPPDEHGMAATIEAALNQRPWPALEPHTHLLDTAAYAHRLADMFHSLTPPHR